MDDLKYLKKHYGENFSHLCRSLFPTLLEHEGMLSKIISEHFAPTRSLYDDIVYFNLQDDFKSYVYGLADLEETKSERVVTKTPEQLMDEAGYILFPECQTEEDIQSFRKYWTEDEELCTFKGDRLDTCRVWFAVKKNVDEIKREDFKNPERQDEYGTSAISIQFSKLGECTLSIKNRYNHTVNHPDSTFSNNLDNIIGGLTQSFVQTYGLDMLKPKNRDFCIEGYRDDKNGKFYRMNLTDSDYIYCDNNVVMDYDGNVFQYDKARYILAEGYLIDKQKNTIDCLKKNLGQDAFTQSVGKINSIATKKDKEGNQVVVFTPETGKDVELTLNSSNQIIGYSNPNVTKIGDKFLDDAYEMRTISLPNVVDIGDDFLLLNEHLKMLDAPNVRKVGRRFLDFNSDLTSICMDNLIEVGDSFLYSNSRVTEASFKNLRGVGDWFINGGRALRSFYAPNLQIAGDEFLSGDNGLTTLFLPKLRWTGNGFLRENNSLEKVFLPELEHTGFSCLNNNECMTTFYAPKLKFADFCFLHRNNVMKDFCAPHLHDYIAGSWFEAVKRTPKEMVEILKKEAGKTHNESHLEKK